MATHGRHSVRRRGAVAALTTTAMVSLRVGRSLLLFGLLSLLATFALGKGFLHLGMSPVLTGSMRPTFGPGDAVVTRMVPTSHLRPGDIAVIVPPGAHTPFAHRIRTVSQTAKGLVVTTKGDANPAPDAWRDLLTQSRVPVVVTHVPKFGYLLVAIREREWRALLIALLGLFITFLATRQILAAPSRPHLAHGARA
jgi:signal peptidase